MILGKEFCEGAIGMEKEMWWTIAVPISLITDRRLSAEARAVYMSLLGLCAPRTNQFSLPLPSLMHVARVGSVITMRAYLDQLERCGWLTITRHGGRRPWHYQLATRPFVGAPAPLTPLGLGASTPGLQVSSVQMSSVKVRAAQGPPVVPSVPVPGALVTHAPVTPAARWLYAFLLTHPEHRSKKCRFRQIDLAAAGGWRSRVTVRSVIAELYEAGWLSIDESFSHDGYAYEPLDPHLALRKTELRRARNRLRREIFGGEGLFKELLTLLIADDQYQDNARLGILINPRTGERMEFDRWYSAAEVAVEFHGAQHYKPGGPFTEEDVNEQRSRDLMKEALARRHGIKLIVIHAEDLTIDRITDMFRNVFPLRTWRDEDPVCRFLLKRYRSYLLGIP